MGASKKSEVLCTSTRHPHLNLKTPKSRRAKQPGKLGSKTAAVPISLWNEEAHQPALWGEMSVQRPEPSLRMNPNFNNQWEPREDAGEQGHVRVMNKGRGVLSTSQGWVRDEGTSCRPLQVTLESVTDPRLHVGSFLSVLSSLLPPTCLVWCHLEVSSNSSSRQMWVPWRHPIPTWLYSNLEVSLKRGAGEEGGETQHEGKGRPTFYFYLMKI